MSSNQVMRSYLKEVNVTVLMTPNVTKTCPVPVISLKILGQIIESNICMFLFIEIFMKINLYCYFHTQRKHDSNSKEITNSLICFKRVNDLNSKDIFSDV